MNTYNNGLGELLGDSLATSKPVITPGFVWFVNSVGGVDAASPAGRDRQKPLATTAQAITNAAAGDIILLEDGHTEILTGNVAVSKQLVIVGGGSAAGIPTVNFTGNAASLTMFTLSVAGTQMRNIRIKPSLQANSATTRFSVTAATVRLKGMYFECGANDQLPAVTIGGAPANVRVNGCTFISTATTVATRPVAGLSFLGSAPTDIDLEGSVFSDGTVGFSGAACDLSGFATRLSGDSLSALLGADILINAASTGFLNLSTSTNGGRITW